MKSINIAGLAVTDVFPYTIDDYSHAFNAFLLMQTGLLKSLASDADFCVLSGVVWSVNTAGGTTTYESTEGYIIFQGELYFAPVQNLDKPEFDVEIPVWNVVIIDEPSEPRLISGGPGTQAIRQERQMGTTLLTSGTGLEDFNQELRLSKNLKQVTTDSGWVNATLINVWTQDASNTLQYRLIDNRLYFRGHVSGDTATAATVFVLGAAFIPALGARTYSIPYSIVGTINISGFKHAITRIEINAAGNVLIPNFDIPDWTGLELSFDGLSILLD